MMDYVTLEIITGKVEQPTHCHGKDGNPPLASGATYGRCNVEGGCKAEYGGGHHNCVFQSTGLSDVLYCECRKNQDAENGNRVKHYFSRKKGDLASYTTLCIYCSEHCRQ